MRTSVEIPDAILKKARRVARDRGTTLRALMIDGLRHVLEENAAPKPPPLEDWSFGEGGYVDGYDPTDHDAWLKLTYGDRSG